MKIALVSRADARGGGASRIAEDTARWLIAHGHDATHFATHFYGPRAAFQRDLFHNDLRGALIRKTHAATQALGLTQRFPIDNYLWFPKQFAAYDIVHFHDHASAFSITGIAQLSEKKPVFFTAHDFLHMTGGCIYPLECKAYQSQCGNCPQRASIGRYDFTQHNLSTNRRAAQQHSIQYLYPSDWLRKEAEAHLRPKRPAITVPNAFDASSYNFKTRSEARRILGLDPQRPILCISAHYLQDRRKGASFALKAAEAVADLNPLVILIGNPLNDAEKLLPNVEFWFSGLVHDRRRMGLLLAASDIFLFTSLQDNLPITIQETMAAGTPVVGFSTGGAPEIIEHGRTGWLVPTGDQDALNTTLRHVLTAEKISSVGTAAAAEIARRFSPSDFIQRHLSLYAAALNAPQKNRSSHDVALA